MKDRMPILILGIGNLLLGDEGIGVHAVEALKDKSLPGEIVLLDGGTGGFYLLPYLEEFSRIILIDAIMDGKAPGTISLIKPRFSHEFPRTLSSHEVGLKDLIESASLLGHFPTFYLITVSIEKIQTMTMELSPDLKQSLPKIEVHVRDILQSLKLTTKMAGN